jgi:hypothetical protein
VRTTPRKRKLRKANDSVLGLFHAEKTQRATPRQTRKLIQHNQSSLFCARDLHASAAALVGRVCGDFGGELVSDRDFSS